MSTQGEKFRAVFFAALMVVSMLAFTTAFAGSAVAANAAGNEDAGPSEVGIEFVGDFTTDEADDSFEAPRVAPFGEEIDVSIDVTNSGSSGTQDTTVEYRVSGSGDISDTDNAETVASETVSLDEGETQTVSFTVDTGSSAFGSATASADTVDNIRHGFSTNPSVGQPLTVGTDSSGAYTTEVLASDTLSGVEGINVSLYNASEFNTVDNPSTPLIDRLETNQDGRVSFSNLAVGPDETNGVRYTVVVNNPDFETGTATRNLFETENTNEDATLVLDRLVNADNIEASPSDPQAGLLETIDSEALVETEDTDPAGLQPLPDTPVDVEIIDSNVDDIDAAANVDDSSLNINPAPPTDTDTDGVAEFEYNLTGINPDEVSQPVEFELEYEATNAGDSAPETDTQTITFVPDIGDTGTLSGQVDIINEDIQVGTQDNVESEAGVEVHAVQVDRVEDNSVEVTTSDGGVEEINSTNISALLDQIDIDDFDDANASIITPTYGSVSGEETSSGDVELDQGNQFRVVTYENGEPIVQDPRSDYLVRDPDGVEVIQNETDRSVEIFNYEGSTSPSFEMAFLSPADDYQVQQKVVIQNTSTEESVSVYQNITVDTNPVGSSSFQTNTEDVFEASEDLTYSATEQRFADERAIQTDVTNDQGNFELLNLPVNVDQPQDYVVMAGGSETGSTATEYGFANFAGYDTVAVEANAADSVAPVSNQYNTDLSVQEFEPVNRFLYDLDVTVDGGQKFVETPVGDSTSVEVTATQQEAGTDDDPVPAENVEIDLEALDPQIGNLASETVTTNTDGEATTTFTGDSPDVGQTNISATIDTGNDIFTTEGGEQATVDVFQGAQITGDVVDDETPSNNLPGAEVTLFEENSTTENSTQIATETAGPQGSFSFTGADGVRSGLNYTVRANFTDEPGNEGTGFAQLVEIPGGTTNADIVIEDVVAPEGFEVNDLQAPASAAPGDEIEVSANITNTAGTEDTSSAEFVFNGSVVDTQELTLGAGATEEVSFTVTVPDVADGDYEHGIQTEIDSATATLNVTSDNGDAGLTEDELRNEYGNEVDGAVETTGLITGISDWRNDDIETSDLIQLIDLWRSDQ